MAKLKYTAEEIVTVAPQVEVSIANGKTTPPHVCLESGITQQTCYRWRKEYRGLKLGQPTRTHQRNREQCVRPTLARQ
jgi:putative transposase